MDTHQKALQINLDPDNYGTFAEIGAGQEVARWFFRVGGAAGTIAKAMSAYDMTFSDAIYGASERYVSRQRLRAMLDHEYGLLIERLDAKRGDATRFFVFADTVAAKSFTRQDEAHGWLGVRFQTSPTAPAFADHHSRANAGRRERPSAGGARHHGREPAHGAIYLHQRTHGVHRSLMDDLTSERVEVDMIEFSGPAFAHVDNRLMSLKLVQNGLTNAAMFTADGEVVQPADVLYKKSDPQSSAAASVRSPTSPWTCCGARRRSSSRSQRLQGERLVTHGDDAQEPDRSGDTIDHQDFLDRVDILGALGQDGAHLQLRRVPPTRRLPVPLHQEDDRHRHGRSDAAANCSTRSITRTSRAASSSHSGGCSRNDLKIYVYPMLDPATGSLITAGNLRVEPHLRHLYAYLQ